MSFFSDRELGPRRRTSEDVSPAAKDGLLAVVDSYVGRDFFSAAFPDNCPDGYGIIGTDVGLMRRRVAGLSITWASAAEMSPYDIFDLLEFCYSCVEAPRPIGSRHSYFNHYHLAFDQVAGRAAFRDDINEILARNGLAFELSEDGRIQRRPPAEFAPELPRSLQTGDATLDALLEAARTKYLSPRVEVQRESLEKLWDAWERLKTLDDPANKRRSTAILIGSASDQGDFRELVTREAVELTDIGNRFLIRHTEVGKTPIETVAEVDYLFQRMFATIWLLLRRSGRV